MYSFNIKTLMLSLFSNSSLKERMLFLKESQYWDISQQNNYQDKSLKELINYAYNNVVYYKKLFDKLNIHPDDINTKSDLNKIPILTKEIINENYNDLISKDYKRFKSQYRKTGGTTGVPLKYLSDLKSWSLHWALKYRAWEWGGYKVGMPIGIMGGASIIPNTKTSFKRKIWNKINGFYPMPVSHVTNEDLLLYANQIEKKEIKFLRGYPSSISNFAEFCIENAIHLNLDSVITTAEVLQDQYKKTINKAFNCVIIDTYGCADGGGNANTCECDLGFHISFEASIWEICNKEGVYVGDKEIGELTLTSLTNFSMPMIRYQPGDLIENSINYEICKCGRTLPRIKRIYGRTTDILKFSNGRAIGGPALTLLFRHFDIINYQIVQNSLTSLDVNIIPSKNFDDGQLKEINNIMSHHCGDDVEIRINIKESILLPKSGKHRFIINNVI